MPQPPAVGVAGGDIREEERPVVGEEPLSYASEEREERSLAEIVGEATHEDQVEGPVGA